MSIISFHKFVMLRLFVEIGWGEKDLTKKVMRTHSCENLQ